MQAWFNRYTDAQEGTLKKLLCCVLLAMAPALAGWKIIAQDDATASYADRETMVRDGAVSTMSDLLDYKDFQRMVEVGYFSQKSQAQYDCKARTVRVLSVALHAEHMGAGKVIYADEMPQEWEAVEPGTLKEKLWK